MDVSPPDRDGVRGGGRDDTVRSGSAYRGASSPLRCALVEVTALEVGAENGSLQFSREDGDRKGERDESLCCGRDDYVGQDGRLICG